MTKTVKFNRKKTDRSLLKFSMVSMLFLLLFVSPQVTWAQFPDVSIRFANPSYNCETNTYCLDVEYQGGEPGLEVFGTNVRFYYDDEVMEFLDFRDFQGDYVPVAPNPPAVTTSSSSFASSMGFSGGKVLDFVNGAIQLMDSGGSALILPNDGSWVKLFQVCFVVDPSKIGNFASFCPPVIWDLEQNPGNGGYQPASDGVVITLVEGAGSAPATESVDQFNWNYTGNGVSTPYGISQGEVCIQVPCSTPLPPQDLPALPLVYKLIFGLIMMGTVVVFTLVQVKKD